MTSSHFARIEAVGLKIADWIHRGNGIKNKSVVFEGLAFLTRLKCILEWTSV